MTSIQAAAKRRREDNQKLVEAGICQTGREADRLRMVLKKDGLSVDKYLKQRDTAKKHEVAERSQVVSNPSQDRQMTILISTSGPNDNERIVYDAVKAALDSFLLKRFRIVAVESTEGTFTPK